MNATNPPLANSNSAQPADTSNIESRIDALQSHLDAMQPLPVSKNPPPPTTPSNPYLQSRLDAMHPLPILKSSQKLPTTTTTTTTNTTNTLISSSSSTSHLPNYKRAFLSSCLSAHVLTFGTYTLKSGRRSPYFFNAGLFHRASLLRSISTAYALTLVAHSAANPAFTFDVVFGPAYKGIPLATATVDKLAEIDGEKYGDLSFSFNRKEVKDHGEGGSIVGASLKGKKVLVLDDVITAGTAMREACSIIAKEGGILVGVVVALDRMERIPGGDGRGSAIGEVRREFGVPVLSIVTLEDLIGELRGVGGEELKRMEEYKRVYGASD